VYSSATAASEVRHLAYQIRLGLWGEGTSFPLGFAQFAEKIEAGGIGAMEMIARDLKAMGGYLCGNLCYGVDPDSGLAVEYREVIHLLSGALLLIWKSLKKMQQDRLNIVRTTTDDGKRLVGVNIPGETIGVIRRAFGLWRNTAANDAEIIAPPAGAVK
jgi:hypothetical protein